MRQTATYCNAPELHRSSVVLGTNGNQFLFRPQTRQIWRADWYNVSSIVISFVNLGFKGLGFRSIVISFVNLGFKGVGFNVRSIVLSFVNLVDFIVNVGTNLSKCRNKPQKWALSKVGYKGEHFQKLAVHLALYVTCVVQGVAVYCSVLQCVAVCCSGYRATTSSSIYYMCGAMCCIVLQCVAVCCSGYRATTSSSICYMCGAVCCNVLQCVAVAIELLHLALYSTCVVQCVAVCCSVLQCVAVAIELLHLALYSTCVVQRVVMCCSVL